jgi:capsular exopolysaccharide synthesis family protein
VAALRRALTVSQQGESRVIAVRVESEDAAKAALLANAVADRYLVDQLQAKFEATERAAVFLTDRLGEVSARLEAAEAAAEAARDGAAAGPGAPGAIRRRMAETAAALAGAEGPRAAALREALAALEREAEAQARAEIALRQAEREVEALSALHEAILARLKETRAQAGLERPDARLIAEAAPPLEPSAANARLVLALALAAGLGFGAAGAFVLESAGGVHHSAEAAERETGLPVLAALPRARDAAARARGRPASRLAEAVRELRAGVLAGAEGPLTVAVLSPGAGEGKSSLAAMLAESCARLGRRTLLVDADLRNPSQAGRYGLSGEEDLGALLEGTALPEEVIWEDPATGLSVLPAQPAPARRAELLAGPAFPAALAGLRARFEVIVIDTPPLLAVADARLAAAAADRSVLALRWGRTTRAEVRAALRTLGEAGARVAGLALTATPAGGDPRPGRDGRGGRYGRFAEYFED